MTGERWLIVPNWFGDDDPSEGLQHYRDRDPVWIKCYRRLLARDEYRELTGHRRAILHGLWLEYATTDGRLRHDTRSLSYRLALKVTTADIEALNHAGFITFTASKPLALSEQHASPRARQGRDREEKNKSSSSREERGTRDAAAAQPGNEQGEEHAAGASDGLDDARLARDSQPDAIPDAIRSELLGLLDELGVAGGLRVAAAQDAARALACARRALAAGTRNPAGLFRRLLESGEWPPASSSSHGSAPRSNVQPADPAAALLVAIRNGALRDPIDLEAEIRGYGLGGLAAGELRAELERVTNSQNVT